MLYKVPFVIIEIFTFIHTCLTLQMCFMLYMFYTFKEFNVIQGALCYRNLGVLRYRCALYMLHIS